MECDSPISVKLYTRELLDDQQILHLVSPYLDAPAHPEKAILDRIRVGLEDGSFVLNLQEVNYVKSHPECAQDYLIFRYKFRVNYKNFDSSGFPLYLLVEPTSICNLKCMMCFQQDSFFRKKENRGFMSLDLFRRIVDEASVSGTGAITMASRGEPLLHKDIGTMLQYTSGKFFEVKLNTNGILLTEEISHAILDSGLNYLVFSVDSTDSDDYARKRVHGDFHKLLENIERFTEIRAKFYPGSLIRTRVSGIQFPDQLNAERFRTFWLNYVDEVGQVKLIDRWDTYNNPKLNVSSPCIRLWYRCYIWWDGTCNPCDYDYQSKLALGSVADMSIVDIWRSEAFERMRKTHREGQRNAYHPCDICPF